MSLWILIVLLIGKRHNCPLKQETSDETDFMQCPAIGQGKSEAEIPLHAAGESHPQCKSHSHFPWPWSPGKHNYLNPIIWNTKGPDQKHFSSILTVQCSAVQCVRLSVMLAWQVCVFVVVLMRPLWPVSSLQSGSSSYGACCSHMELALSGHVAGLERGLHLSAHSTAGVSLSARPPLRDGLQMHPTVLLHHQV